MQMILLIELGIHPKIQQSQMRFSSLIHRQRNGRDLNRSASGASRRTHFDQDGHSRAGFTSLMQL
jgi:hypothetical protein